jgi:UDP-N-acetylglucosamine--N-acetylmuramyl-(pentapeptide) pyrophosphoryl-undecaprenol N-acetylglucosamine transferase
VRAGTRSPNAPWLALFSGGGTGGHLYPALALSAALAERRPDVRHFFIGAERGIEARVLPARGVDHLLVPVLGASRTDLLANLRVLRMLVRALSEVARAFQRLRPNLVVVTGGYAGGPAGLMAVLMRVRLVVQEQNSVPGVTTRALSMFADQVHLAFPEAVERLPSRARRKVRLSGNPVRRPSPVDRLQAAAAFGLDPKVPVVLVVGGSQGSRALNAAVLEAVTMVTHGEIGGRRTGASGGRPVPDLQLLWSTGPTHLHEVRSRLGELGDPDWVHALPYIEEMPQALGLARVAVSRAGAMATSEFLAWGLPAILVPFPHAAADHQRRNAAALADAGAAVLLPEDILTGRDLWARLAELVADPAAHRRMSRNARTRGNPEAAAEIAAALDALLPPPARQGPATQASAFGTAGEGKP